MVGRRGQVVIPGSGIDVERFERAGATGSSPAELRKALGLGASEVVITVTRMTRQKGIPTLLDAAALVHQHRPGVRFLLVGPRESEGPFAVTQAEIDEYLEGVPRALLEAAVSGRPIVTTRMPGCTDVIRDGWNGFLVPPRDPRLMAERILDLLRNRVAAAAMGARAAQLVRKEVNLEITVARYAAVYEDLVRRSVRSRLQMRKDALEPEPYAQDATSTEA